MTNQTNFTAQLRDLKGKKVKRLRQEGKTPANIHGNLKQSLALEIETQAFRTLYEDVGDTGLIYLKIEGEDKERPVLIDDVVYDPVSDALEHVVFKQVNLSQKITAEVPVELVGENEVPEAVVVTVVNAVEVEALPTDLPEKFEVDISGLTKIGQSITFTDLKYDSQKVKLMIEEEELTNPIVLLQEQAEEEEEEVVEETPEEGAEEKAASEEDKTTESADKADSKSDGASPKEATSDK